MSELSTEELKNRIKKDALSIGPQTRSCALITIDQTGAIRVAHSFTGISDLLMMEAMMRKESMDQLNKITRQG